MRPLEGLRRRPNRGNNQVSTGRAAAGVVTLADADDGVGGGRTGCEAVHPARAPLRTNAVPARSTVVIRGRLPRPRSHRACRRAPRVDEGEYFGEFAGIAGHAAGEVPGVLRRRPVAAPAAALAAGRLAMAAASFSRARRFSRSLRLSPTSEVSQRRASASGAPPYLRRLSLRLTAAMNRSDRWRDSAAVIGTIGRRCSVDHLIETPGEGSQPAATARSAWAMSRNKCAAVEWSALPQACEVGDERILGSYGDIGPVQLRSLMVSYWQWALEHQP